MAEIKMAPDLAEQQKTAAAFISSVLNSGADPLLKAQADLLVSIEAMLTDWLHRRHEAVVDTQKLVARLRESSDPAGALSAQQEWMTGAFHLLAADMAAWQSAMLQLVNRSGTWAQQGADAAARVAPEAAEAARATTRPLRAATGAD
jgi:hypothetical protein